MRIPKPLALVASAALALFLSVGPSPGRAAPPPPPNPGGAAAGGDDEAQAYAKFLKDATRQDGLFPVIVKDGKVFLELRTDQFGKDFYEHATSANGLGGYGLLSGDDFLQEARILHFVRVDAKHVALIWPHERFLAPAGSPLATAVKASTADSVQAVVGVAAEDKDAGKVVIDTAFLLGDNLNLGNTLSDIVENRSNPQGGYRLDSQRSYYGAAKAFPKNDIIEVDQTFASAKPDVIDTVTDPHSIQLRIKYNFAEVLSTPGYVPRLVDDRVGYWSNVHVAFDNDSHYDDKVSYITRWNIQASDPTRPSPAKRPLVYTLTNTIPLEYRPAIRDAVLEWNKAFARIGILDAIQVQDQPSDPNWDPDDIRYNTIRWLTEANDGGFAEAQAEWDPRTGEIFRSGVLIDADIVRYAKVLYTDTYPVGMGVQDPATSVSPAQALDPSLWDAATTAPVVSRSKAARRLLGTPFHRDMGMREQAAFGALALQMYDGALPPNFTYDYMKSIIMHESGHDFGLAHNFIGHDAFTADELKSKAFTERNGIASSVMEYAPINLWPKGSPHGDYWQTTLGPYDYHVIHWGYAAIAGAKTPADEVPTLNRWASAAFDRNFAFASDEDVEWNGHAVDPRVAQWMLTDRPVDWCEVQLGIDKSMLGNLSARLPQRQRNWDQERFSFSVLMNEYNRCAASMTHYVGGEFLTRGRPGDPGIKAALSPIPRSDEEHAFRNLDKYLFAESAWNVSPATLNRTVYSEYEPIDGFGYDPLPRHDISLNALVGTYQARALSYMFSPLVLQRLADMPNKARPGATMSIADLFAWSQASIFGDLQSGRAPKTPIRRNLQRMYSRVLEKMATAPAQGTPYDAQALARHELVSLAGDLRRDLMRNDLDLQARAHLEAMFAEVTRSLDARGVIQAT